MHDSKSIPKVFEKDSTERFKKAVDIAERMVGSHHVPIDEVLQIISIHEGKVRVYDSFNAMHVHDSSQLDLALDLATCYEEAFGGEYKIRKQY